MANHGEDAVLEVKIGDQWVEWDRIHREPGGQWDGYYLASVRPQVRVRFEDPACPYPGCAMTLADGHYHFAEHENAQVEIRYKIGFELDPFCPRHGRRSLPAEVPGLRCDCHQGAK